MKIFIHVNSIPCWTLNHWTFNNNVIEKLYLRFIDNFSYGSFFQHGTPHRGGSRWIIGVGFIRWVIHPLRRGVAIPVARQALASARPSGHFFSAIFVSFHNRSSRLTFFVCFYVIFHSCCFHAHVFGKTLEHEFHFSCSRTEWNLHSLLSENGDEICKQSAVKLNFKLTSNTGDNQWPILSSKSVIDGLK